MVNVAIFLTEFGIRIGFTRRALRVSTHESGAIRIPSTSTHDAATAELLLVSAPSTALLHALFEGEQVQFDIERGDRGTKAVNVEKV